MKTFYLAIYVCLFMVQGVAQQSRMLQFNDSIPGGFEITTLHTSDSSTYTFLSGVNSIVIKSDQDYNILWQKKFDSIRMIKAIEVDESKLFFVGSAGKWPASAPYTKSVYGMIDSAGNISWASKIDYIKDSLNSTYGFSARDAIKISVNKFGVSLQCYNQFRSVFIICDSTGTIQRVKYSPDCVFFNFIDFKDDSIRVAGLVDQGLSGTVALWGMDTLLNYSGGYHLDVGSWSSGTGFSNVDIVKANSGKIYETATGYTSSGAPEGYVRCYDSLGNFIWGRRNPVMLQVPPVVFKGQFAVDSRDNSFFTSDYTGSSLISFDSTGNIYVPPFWHSRYDQSHTNCISVNMSDDVFLLKGYGSSKLNIISLDSSLAYNCSEQDSRTFNSTSAFALDFTSVAYFTDSLYYSVSALPIILNSNVSALETQYCGVFTSAAEHELVKVSLFPNPATEKLNVSLSDSENIFNMRLFDSTGREVFSGQFDKPAIELNCGSFLPGIYFGKINNGEYSFRLMKL